MRVHKKAPDLSEALINLSKKTFPTLKLSQVIAQKMDEVS